MAISWIAKQSCHSRCRDARLRLRRVGRCRRYGKEVGQGMVFVNEEFDSATGIIVCGYYKPYGKWKNDPETAGAPYDLYSGT